MSHNKTSLLASLTGGDADAEQDLFGDIPGSSDNVEEDLFGNISLDDPLQHSKVSAVLSVAPTPSNVSNINGARPPVSNVPAPPPAPAASSSSSSSLLASSGLLGDDNHDYDPRSDGLFDAVDDEQARSDQEEQRRRAVQHERIEQERARQQEAERAAEQARLSQQMQSAQQQSQQAHAHAHAHAPIQGFYRNHNPPPRAVPPPLASSYNGNLQYSTTGGPVQTHTIRRPITTAGMHNSSTLSGGGNMIRPPSRTITAPTTSTESPYLVIKVTEPMLVASGGLFLNSPYWSYQVETSLKERGHWLVRRRFKHVVALEDRLRQECPGSILPPRPDKHATRAIEEASTLQSAEFALQRAQELSQYLNELAQHPYCCSSTTLRLFLALQDDMGTAWPEVSSNTFTRLSALGGSGASSVITNLPPKHELEDNAELLALHSSEELRMGAVTQAVPKLEGCITLLKEHADASGAVGMELSKLCKQVETSESEILPLSTLSSGLLRAGRREKRLAVELSASMQTFIHQYKVCRYEKMAFYDRRQALTRCHKERVKADERAQKLLFAPAASQGEDHRLAREAVVCDELAVNAVREAQEIGQTIKSEVNRVAFERRTEWSKSMKVVASAMKEASTERVAIWESTRESFLHAFPDCK